MNLKIEYLPKEELKPYANNAKIHTAQQIEQIKNSIEKFGFNDPIAVWKNNEIIEGHGRLLAAMEMDDIDVVPVIRLDSLTDKERRAYMIAHNKITENTGFDNDVLSIELKDLMADVDFTDIGFGDFELTMLTEDLTPEPYDNEEIKEYDNGDKFLMKNRVIITFEEKDRDKVQKLLNLSNIDKVVYDISEILN